MGSGRIGTAPCGHRGEAVIGQYYHCLEGCDDGSPEINFELVLDKCPVCESTDLDFEFELDADFYIFHPHSPILDLDTRCNDCGRCYKR